jgi:putative ABC transport system ATP-binding protein
MFLEIMDIKKSYGEGGNYMQVLKRISAYIKKGQMCVFQGNMRLGKSTLLNCISGLDVLEDFNDEY